MKKSTLLAAAAIPALPTAANAQDFGSSWSAPTLPTYQGFYIGAAGPAHSLVTSNRSRMGARLAAGIGLEGRYYGTANDMAFSNNNIMALMSLSYKFGQPEAPPPPPPPVVTPPSFMVFFDWDRSNLSQQALTTIQQAANAFKTKGSARITATGHTDTSGPESYNMALSLRRANAVKDALVRDGVPSQAITVVGIR